MKMDFDFVFVLSAKVAAFVVFVYGLIVFADQGAGQLFKGGVAYVVSPYIWGSNNTWPLAGGWAVVGLVMAMIGFLVLRFSSRQSDFSSDIPYFWPFLRALVDTLILFFALCLTWEILLSYYEPTLMFMQVIQYLDGTGITNNFVLNFSAIMLVLLWTFKLRSRLFRWLPSWVTSRKFTLRFGALSLSVGLALFVTAIYMANSSNIVGILSQPPYISCSEECYFVGTLDLAGGVVGVIFVVVGLLVSMERLLAREPVP